MANLYARSPYIVSVNETNQIESKIELRIWNGTGSAPTNPTYTISKLIPAPNVTLTSYNISPYIREFLSHPSFTNNYNTQATGLSGVEWCNVEVKRYYKTATTFILKDTVTHRAFDGYSLYTEGFNEVIGNYMLRPKTYYYLYESVADGNLAAYPLYRPGDLTFICASGQKVKYSEIGTGLTHQYTINTTGVVTTFRVYPLYYDNGNKLEILDASDNVLYTATFKPKTECRYEPVCCDFINRYGAWQREYFFKASRNNIEVQNTEYNLLQNTLINFNVLEGQRKVFNTNYSESITVNTDWVTEDFSDNLRELMTSERILLDNRPVKLNTKSMELQKQVNTKMINYTLEFEYATDIINNVV